MAVRLEKEGVDECISRITDAISKLSDGASIIDKAMNELPKYWEGDAYNKANRTYKEEYKTLLTKTVPSSVENFNQFINGCKTTIMEIDTQLGAG